MRKMLFRVTLAFCSVMAISQIAFGQASGRSERVATANAEQTAHILGLDVKINQLRTMRTRDSDDPVAAVAEMRLRQELLESIQAANLDADSVLSELANERGQLVDLRFSLQSRRDRTVGRLNAAALLTGSGLGAAVSASQFTSLSSRTQNIGDGLGIGSGVASTLFALLAVRKQSGPRGTVGTTPNMLAPLLSGGSESVLSSDYPAPVMLFLQTVPANSDVKRGTRLEQLREQWATSGRLDTSDSAKRQQKISVLTTSMDTTVRISIDDLTDRIAMLTDVSGRVSLMKRDLSLIMRSCLAQP